MSVMRRGSMQTLLAFGLCRSRLVQAKVARLRGLAGHAVRAVHLVLGIATGGCDEAKPAAATPTAAATRRFVVLSEVMISSLDCKALNSR